MKHQVHCKHIHQQSANVPAEKMLSYDNQSSHLISPDERYDDWTFRTHRGAISRQAADKIFPTDRGSNPVTAADDDVARVCQHQQSLVALSNT